jgi:hypothetical protein
MKARDGVGRICGTNHADPHLFMGRESACKFALLFASLSLDAASPFVNFRSLQIDLVDQKGAHVAANDPQNDSSQPLTF